MTRLSFHPQFSVSIRSYEKNANIDIFAIFVYASRKAQYKDAYRRKIDILQRAHIFKVNCCFNVRNAHLN